MDKINLYLDDLRDCPEGFLLAATLDEAIEILKRNKIHILSLDHDLGVDEITGVLLPSGYDLVKYICENGLRADKIYLHTDNPVGRDNMYETLKAAKRRGFIDGDIEIYKYPYVKNRYTDYK